MCLHFSLNPPAFMQFVLNKMTIDAMVFLLWHTVQPGIYWPLTWLYAHSSHWQRISRSDFSTVAPHQILSPTGASL